MKIKLFFFSMCFITLFGLGGCRNFSLKNKGQDFVKVTDLSNHKTHTTYGKSNVKKVFASSTDYDALHKKSVPVWAKKKFRYAIHYSKHDMTIKILIYSNYKYAKISGVPLVGNGLLRLNDTQFHDLNNPNSLFKKWL